jgi:PAS domain S-box-containing protein
MSERATLPPDRTRDTVEPDFRELANIAPILVRRTGIDRLSHWVNRPWLDFTGQRLADALGEGWQVAVHPDDAERHRTTVEQAFQARACYGLDYRLRRHDGHYRWITEHGTPSAANAPFDGYWASCIDVTDYRGAQQSQRILINELNHRMKNTLTVVQAMAEQTFQPGRPMTEAIACFGGRLRALTLMQDRLVAGAWEPVSLHDLVLDACAPLDPGGGRIRVDGPRVIVDAEKAVTLTMALHELLTNALKYGALSNDTGHVSIAWRTCERGDDPRVQLAWKERGGPAVCVPTGRGFGSRFVERCLGGGPCDRSTLCFEKDGVRWTLETSLAGEYLPSS